MNLCCRAVFGAALLVCSASNPVTAQTREDKVAEAEAGGPGADEREGGLEVPGTFPTIGEALMAASPGDTVTVSSGTYRESLWIDRAVVLIGRGWPVVDGGGEGHVIEAVAPITLRGFVVRGSGDRVDAEHAGIMVRDAPARIEANRFEDVFYGIYLKNAPGSVVRDNRIEGKPFPRPRRGDGIRLWESSGSLIERNQVIGTRDVVIFFSDGLVVSDNLITDGRYGLHYMYSDQNRFERNRFLRNEVGAFIMYSADIRLIDNVFAEAEGLGGMGLGLKDADDVVAAGNLFARNGAGIHLDNSPLTRGAVNRFEDNLIFDNRVGVRLLPAVQGNTFHGNDLVDNLRPVEIAGRGGSGFRNRWQYNFWSDYAGFDAAGDGIGDTPFVYARIADELVVRHPALQLFALSPVMQTLDVLSRVFPLLEPQPTAVDSNPRLRAAQLTRWEREAPVPTAVAGPRGAPAAGVLVWAGLGLLAVGGLGAAFRRPVTFRRRGAERTGFVARLGHDR